MKPQRRSEAPGSRTFDDDLSLNYRVVINQERRGKGLTDAPPRTTRIEARISEQGLPDGRYAIVLREVSGSGEPTQIDAARRLVGARTVLNSSGAVERFGDETNVFSGEEDIGAIDIALLFQVLAPLIPDEDADEGRRWHETFEEIRVPWSERALGFGLDNRLERWEEVRGIRAATISSNARAGVVFPLPYVEEAPDGSGREPILNDIFEILFAPPTHPIEGLGKALAAIPIAILAPFIGLLEGIASIFESQDDRTTIKLAGPIELNSSTLLYEGDGRVLRASGEGTANLLGRFPQTQGQAAPLSGRELALEVRWTYSKELLSPWPKPTFEVRSLWLALATALVGAALTLQLIDRRRRRQR